MKKRLPTIVVLLGLVLSLPGRSASKESYCECTENCAYPTGSCCCEFGVEDYPTDDLAEYLVLDAYRLWGDLEQNFKADDGGLSSFWSAWDDSAYDRVILKSGFDGNDYYGTWDEPRDAQMEARAAYGDYGLYLCFIIDDNNFVDTPIVDTSKPVKLHFYQLDAVDMCFDRYPTQVHRNEPDLFLDIHKKRITIDMVQLQQPFARLAPPETISRNHVADTGSGLTVIYERSITSSDLKSRFGIKRDIIIINDRTRAQEWFIPYEQIGGNGGISFPMPGSERNGKIAFSFGYNDVDFLREDDADTWDPLRWRNASSPFKEVGKYNYTSHQSLVPAEPWGDIRFVEQSVSVRNTRTRPSIRTPLGGVPAERYDIRGRKIPTSSPITGRGAVLLRKKLPNGSEFVERSLHGL